VAIAFITLLLMLFRPRQISEATAAVIGAVLLLVTRAVPLDRLPHAINETGGVLLFLLGMMLLTGIAERARVFDVLAESVVRLARGNGRLLLVLVYVLGAMVTAVLSLDVTVIVLTPIVYSLISRRKIAARPFMFACVFSANIASLVLPVSNLTNLLVYARRDPGFLEFVSTMWLPNLVAGVTNLLLFLWIFRKDIPHRFPREQFHPIQIDRWLLLSGAILSATLIGILGLGLANRPIWWAAIGGGCVLLVLALLTRRITIPQIRHDVAPSIFVFVIAMTIVVEGVQRAWLNDQAIAFPDSLPMALLGSIGLTAIGSNVVNNIPAVVLALGVIERAPPAMQDALTWGSLIGANIGPALTTYGSLATMLWLTQLRRRGIQISSRTYLRISSFTVPLVLLASGFTLWLVLH
jgi:arsenical pump membrane protein